MWNKKKGMLRLAAVLMTLFSCSRPASQQSVRRMPAGQEFSGYLSTYANLKANPEFDSTVSYVSQDPVKNIHKYVAVIVEPPVVYIATDTDEKALPDRGRTALAEYFQHAITDAVEDAFPIVQTSGPLVLRLRSAIVGVDVGQAVPADQKDEKSLERPINIGKVGVEMEYKNFTVKDTRGNPEHSFVIGPTVAYRTSKNTRFDISALAGVNDDSPAVEVFAVFSWILGPAGGEEHGEAPVSTRNR